jgi:hypothetical protein
MIIQAGKYFSFHCSVRYLMRGIYVAETWKFLRVMFPRDEEEEEEEEEERTVHKSMISEISVKVSNVSLYVRVTKYLGFEVLREVVIKNSVFWDITTCSQKRSACYLVHAVFFVHLFFDPEDEGEKRHVPSKRRLTFNGLLGVITKKIESFER